MKLCRGCGQEKEGNQFPANKSSPDGLHSRCRSCRAEVAMARRNRPEVKEADAVRGRARYQMNRDVLLAKRKERYEANKEHERRRNMAWSNANREYHRALNREWAKKNPVAARTLITRRRALIAGAQGSHSKDDVAALMVEQRGCCAACRCDLGKSGYHVDHMMPLSKGGANDKSNLQLLCPTCNRRKGAKLPDDWKREIHR